MAMARKMVNTVKKSVAIGNRMIHQVAVFVLDWVPGRRKWSRPNVVWMSAIGFFLVANALLLLGYNTSYSDGFFKDTYSSSVEAYRYDAKTLQSLDSSFQDKTIFSDAPYYLRPNTSMCKSNVFKLEYRKWSTFRNRFLLALCSYSRFSNRIRCFQNYILLASILKRVLIIPYEDLNPYGVPYKYQLAFSVIHFRKCFGSNTVLSLSEYLLKYNQTLPLKIDKAMILYPARNELKRTDLFSFPPDTYKFRKEHKFLDEETIKSKFFKSQRTVTTFGDIFILRQHMLFDMRKLIRKRFRKRKCKLVFKPSFAVIEAANGFVRHFIQSRYISLHFRRDDFYDVLKSKGRLWSTLESVECVKEVMKRHGLNKLFVATDATEDEMSMFRKALENDSASSPSPVEEKFSMFRLTNMKDKEWAASLNKFHLYADPLAIAMVEKVIASMASLFIYTEFSTFSAHISEIRMQLSIGCKDEYICQARNKTTSTFRV